MNDLKTFGIYKGEGKYEEEILYSLAVVYHRANHRISTYLKDFDLTVGKFNILVAIRHHGRGQGLPQVEISKHLILTPSNMTKMIDKLEQEEFVTRSALEGDRRVNIVQTTPMADKLLDRLWAGFKDVMAETVSGLNSRQQKQLAELLTGWAEQLQG